MGGLALKKIFSHFGTDDFAELINFSETNENDFVKLNAVMDKVSIIAFYGIENGYLKEGGRSPFQTIDDMLVYVDNINDIMPAFVEYTKSMGKFFKESEQSEGEAKGETVTSPALPLPN